MSRLRTEEEKAAILNECLRLEKEGGDILGYLWSQDYVTPRATWCNYQREWLGRKPYQYTDGKPKKKGEKKMGKPVNTKEDRQRRLDELIERVNKGMGIRAALADMGYSGKSAGQQYRQLRNFAKENDPIAYAALPESIGGDIVPVTSLADAMQNCQDAADEFFGKCEEMGLKTEVPEEPKICQPVVYEDMIVREVEGLFGRYRRSDIGGKVYIDFEPFDTMDVMSFTVEQWRSFREEQVKAAAILGVEL